jgi:hypothetical protein
MSGAGSSKDTASVNSSTGSKDTASVNITETEKQRLIREFVLITKTDSKCATFFLENHDWKLQVSTQEQGCGITVYYILLSIACSALLDVV